MRQLLLLAFCMIVFCGCAESFENLKKKHIKFSALNVTFEGSQKSIKKFYKLVERFSLDLWKSAVDAYDYAIVVIPDKLKQIRRKFRKAGIREAIENLMDDQFKKTMLAEFERIHGRTMNGQTPFDLKDVNTFEQMELQLKKWKKDCDKNKDLKCRIEKLGDTLQNNPINMFSIGLAEVNTTPSPSTTTTPSQSTSPSQNATPTPTQTPTPSPTPSPSPTPTADITSTTTPNVTTIPLITTEEPKIKKGVWIDCLIHAREWLSGTTCMLFINKLITEYKKPEVKKLLEEYDWHFVPIMNPDGYKYSWSFNVGKPKDYPWKRLQRKNRKDTCDIVNKDYLDGVDLNRNYNDGHWRDNKKPCDHQIYSGDKAASEKETQAIQSQLTKDFNWPLCSDEELKAAMHLDLLLTVHSFANAWMFPTARTVNGGKECAEINKEDAQVLKKLTDAAAAASKKAGGQAWKSGPVCKVLSRGKQLLNAPGNLMDYAFEKAKIKHSVAVELRGPFFTIGNVADVTAAFEETWAGVVAMLDNL